MALVHEFAIISKESSQRSISDAIYSVSISDFTILYIRDSLQWINSIWNDRKSEKGICYYGYSIIEGEEIKKLKDIITQWKELFCLSPDEMYLTGDFLLDKNRYEKIMIRKECILGELTSLIEMCEEAIEKEANILHSGI